MKYPTLTLIAAAALACGEASDADPVIDSVIALDGGISDAKVIDASGSDVAVADVARLPDSAVDQGPVGGERPAQVYVPSGVAPATGWPILLLLHGFGAAPATVDRNFPFSPRVDDDGWIVVVPEGRRNDEGRRYWAADFHVEPDGRGADVDYLLGVIDEVVERRGGDPNQVVVMGHSNGGSMAQHLACYAADRLVAYVNVSGYNLPEGECIPSRPISALHVHGTADVDVPYVGRDDRPGAEASAEHWALQVLDCAERAPDAGPFDYDLRPGTDTTTAEWTGCSTGRVGFWRMDEIPHVIIPTAAFLDAIRAFALTD